MNKENIDITNILIDKNLPQQKRLESFLNQINPYHFLYKDFEIELQFSQTDKTIKDVLNDYHKALKNQL